MIVSPLLFYIDKSGLLLFYYESEAVTMNIHNFDIGIVFQVFTQFGNVYVHAAAIEVGIATPYFLQGQFAW